MYSLNKAQIIGNLTRDPEVRQTNTGQMVSNLGVATNRVWKDPQGKKQEQVEFHNIVVWGKLAEICGQYLKKGQKVYFEGRLQTRTWDDENGKKNYKTEIVGEDMIMLSNKGEGGGDFAQSAPAPQTTKEDTQSAESTEPVEPAVSAGSEKISVEDLPF